MKSSIGWNHGSLLLVLLLCVMAVQRSNSNSCPTGFQLRLGTCYKYVRELKTFQQASDACEAMGSFLADPRSQAEFDALPSITPDDVAWLGLSDSQREGKWMYTSDNSLMVWNKWNPHRHSYGITGDCVAMSKSQWLDVPCTYRLYSICQYNFCATGFKLYGANCYRYVQELKNFQEASDTCEAMGAFLAAPRSQAEFDLLPKTANDDVAWLGASDSQREGEWRYISDDSIVTWNRWARDWLQPDDGTSGNCLALYISQWFDMACDNTIYFICQYNGAKVFPFPNSVPKSYEEARKVCKSHDMVLPEPKTNQANKQLSQLNTRGLHGRNARPMFYLGLRRHEANGDWLWDRTHQKLGAWTSWQKKPWNGNDQPDRPATELCAAQLGYYAHARSGKAENWADVPCGGFEGMNAVVCVKVYKLGGSSKRNKADHVENSADHVMSDVYTLLVAAMSVYIVCHVCMD